ncbi:uncharacterized protein PGTG_15312 [Puccinia graminis f. sp. tritici CRL 75-36-700-3]|uniref:Uncharacterized protein n=1 Tax=Puccinia graminis f. sp. tritici (strain CRL 75-36-700-3 / race SCCL) TaxID=418459 RepID=E3KYS4_PUCGT|nr:uncharacterized protein PGTG_15312 [Puccinia graminis f. sp. tritici CRL 75-36-700-3]EFP89470.1 hypothetical protein PGTG_15312 [Puccinia graminis f. sp. tritici CRL 75-36-700-3]
MSDYIDYNFELYTSVEVQKCNKIKYQGTCPPGHRPRVSNLDFAGGAWSVYAVRNSHFRDSCGVSVADTQHLLRDTCQGPVPEAPPPQEISQTRKTLDIRSPDEEKGVVLDTQKLNLDFDGSKEPTYARTTQPHNRHSNELIAKSTMNMLKAQKTVKEVAGSPSTPTWLDIPSTPTWPEGPSTPTRPDGPSNHPKTPSVSWPSTVW